MRFRSLDICYRGTNRGPIPTAPSDENGDQYRCCSPRGNSYHYASRLGNDKVRGDYILNLGHLQCRNIGKTLLRHISNT